MNIDCKETYYGFRNIKFLKKYNTVEIKEKDYKLNDLS